MTRPVEIFIDAHEAENGVEPSNFGGIRAAIGGFTTYRESESDARFVREDQSEVERLTAKLEQRVRPLLKKWDDNPPCEPCCYGCDSCKDDLAAALADEGGNHE